jgi:hypothetical protein
MPQLSNKEISKISYLRKRGHSLPEIRRLTGHSNSTVFKYIQGVEILPRFQEVWKNKRKSSVFRCQKDWEKARAEARQLIKDVNKEGRILLAVGLYWAEGAKLDFSFTNTDPRMIRVFVECLKTFGIQSERLRIHIRVFEDLEIRKATKFWAKVVGVPEKYVVSVNVLNGKKKGKLQYGMCRLRVLKGGYMLKLVNGLVDVVSERTLSSRNSMDRIPSS